jgi:hypothetical protein
LNDLETLLCKAIGQNLAPEDIEDFRALAKRAVARAHAEKNSVERLHSLEAARKVVESCRKMGAAEVSQARKFEKPRRRSTRVRRRSRRPKIANRWEGCQQVHQATRNFANKVLYFREAFFILTSTSPFMGLTNSSHQVGASNQTCADSHVRGVRKRKLHMVAGCLDGSRRG